MLSRAAPPLLSSQVAPRPWLGQTSHLLYPRDGHGIAFTRSLGSPSRVRVQIWTSPKPGRIRNQPIFPF